MEKIKELKTDIEGVDLTPQKNISPSSINQYYRCPRSYFYRYIAKLPEELSIHLIKGGIVHKVLEDFFRGYKENLKETMFKIFERVWEKSNSQLKQLELTEEENTAAKKDCSLILNEYLISFLRKMGNLKISGKAENNAHAFYLLKPKFREMFVKDEALHCRGFIDRISKDFDGILTLADYKTSSKYGIGLPSDYKRQLAIYALLYTNQEEETPDFVAVMFLRYGEEYLLEVTPSLLRYALNTITDVYTKTRTVDIKDYPLTEGILCKWCPFISYCTGKEDYMSKLREKTLEKLFKTKTFK